MPLPLPAFNVNGLLPPNDYMLSLEELGKSLLVVGPQNGTLYPHWDSGWRAHLVDNLSVLANQLWQVGITDIFVNGSFVEDKEHPNDIDGYFNCDLRTLASGQLEQALNLLDPHKIWTWNPHSRKPHPSCTKRQLPMWHQYRVELYPHVPGLPCGIKDIYANELEFPAAFRQRRTDSLPKGIVKLVR